MRLDEHVVRRRLAWASALLVMTLPMLAHAEEAGSPEFGKLVGLVRWSGVFVSTLVIVGAAIALRVQTTLVHRLSERFTDRRLQIQQASSFIRFFVYFVTGTVCIALSFRINQTIITLIGGTLAVAVGFAMRDLVAAIIAGVTIMLDRPFQVGDRVQYAGQYGDIVEIGLRSVRMQTLDDNTVTIPNNKVLTDVTSCGNYGALDMQVKVSFRIGVDQDFAKAETLVTEGFLTSRYVFLDKPVVVLVSQDSEGGVPALKVTGKGYVLDTKYEKAFESDVTKRVLLAFRQHGIQPPAMLYRAVGPTIDGVVPVPTPAPPKVGPREAPPPVEPI